jgi:hypothetical protein
MAGFDLTTENSARRDKNNLPMCSQLCKELIGINLMFDNRFFFQSAVFFSVPRLDAEVRNIERQIVQKWLKMPYSFHHHHPTAPPPRGKVPSASVSDRIGQLVAPTYIGHFVVRHFRLGKRVAARHFFHLGSMLWSQFSAIFNKFRRKIWRFSKKKTMLWSNFCII